MQDRRIRVHDEGDLRRRRLVVLFRLFLYLPHYVVLTVWTLLLVPVVPIAWLTALFTGRVPVRLHRWLSAFLCYSGQTTAWLYLLSGRYPDPLHTKEHPFGIEVPAPQPQQRPTTLLRLPLAFPAIVLASAFNVVLTTSAVGAWLVAMTLARTTAGLQELGTFCLRYQLETQAYLLLLTATYPRLVPTEALPTPEPE